MIPTNIMRRKNKIEVKNIPSTVGSIQSRYEFRRSKDEECAERNECKFVVEN